jgi:hypothetical protein
MSTIGSRLDEPGYWYELDQNTAASLFCGVAERSSPHTCPRVSPVFNRMELRLEPVF